MVRKICLEQILTAEQGDAGPKDEAQVDKLLPALLLHSSHPCGSVPYTEKARHIAGLLEELLLA